MNKIKNDIYYMNYALNISTDANCIKGKVGAVFVKDNQIISGFFLFKMKKLVKEL